jgi:recombination protein RecT
MTTVQAAVVALRDEQDHPSIALPAHLDAGRIARLALTAVRTTPKLAQCTPESFAGSLLESAALGLEPNVEGESYLVPYKGECTLIVGYKGYTKLYWQHPLARHLDAQAVREADEFDYAYGLDPYLRHKPGRGDRGPIVDYYAVAQLATGARMFVVLSPEEVRALRRGKTGPSGDIPDPQGWMERKTVLRQLFKLTPKSRTLARAIESDEVGGHALRQRQIAEHTPAPALVSVPDRVEVHDGEVVDVVDGPITDQQMKLLQKLFKDNGVTDRDVRLAYVSDLLGRPVKSANELSVSEASRVIDALDPQPPSDEPPLDGAS